MEKSIVKNRAKSLKIVDETGISLNNKINDENKFGKILNISKWAGLLFLAIFGIYGYSKGIFTSETALRELISSWGIFAPIIFVLIQIVQVVVPIIPGGVSSLIGVQAFGNGLGFIYNYVGIVIGSIVAFLLAKKYGTQLVKATTKPEIFEKYKKWIDGERNFDKFFAAAIFFPMAPDDLLCYLAGLTKMDLKKFSLIVLLGKPLGIFAYTWILKYSISLVMQLF